MLESHSSLPYAFHFNIRSGMKIIAMTVLGFSSLFILGRRVSTGLPGSMDLVNTAPS